VTPDQKKLAAEIYTGLIWEQYALPEGGFNDQHLEDLASIAVRAVKAFEWACEHQRSCETQA
jgi:hypothetical protein